MQIERNQISRDWTVGHDGRTFLVNYTESDTQTLALCNRDNWEIWEETEEGTEELNSCVFSNDIPEQKERAAQNALLIERLIKFCMENWDNPFMQQIEDELVELRMHMVNIKVSEGK